jgi:hypothetical protein
LRFRPALSCRPVLKCTLAAPACVPRLQRAALPSRNSGDEAAGEPHEVMHYPGALLNVATLPELPAEPRSAELKRSSAARPPRTAAGADRRRGEACWPA